MKKLSTGGPPSIWRGLRNFWNDESGAVMLETVIVFPIQLLLTMVILQAAFIWAAAGIINYAAFQAARTALVEIRGTEITPLIHKKAWLAAFTITSVLSNPITETSQRANAVELRTLHHNYYFPGHHFAGTYGLQVYLGFHRDRSDAPDDEVIGAAIRYYYPLTVPLAGMLMGRNYSGGVWRGVRFIPMEQTVFLPKPWPY